MMQRIETSNSSNTPNFIGSWILKDKEMCDEIVNFLDNVVGFISKDIYSCKNKC